MLNYVAAVATAVTLMISPMVSSNRDSGQAEEPAKWAKQAETRTLEIQQVIEISGGLPAYVLTVAEQQVFRRALLRSVKLVS